MSPAKNPIVRALGGLWRIVDAARRVVVNLLFLAILVALVVVLVPVGRPKVPKGAALVVAPSGRLVEQLAGDPMDRAVDRLLGREPPETMLKDVLDAILAAAGDDRIGAMLLDLNQFEGASLSKLQEVRSAIVGFSGAGKRVVATGDLLDTSGYYLAAAADEIIMRRDGLLLVEGYGAYRTYLKEGLDRLGVDVNVFRVGEYKSFTEPFERNDMSPEAREESLDWLGDLWQAYLTDVAEARDLPVETLRTTLETFDRKVVDAGGHLAQAALDAKLIDEIGPRDRVRDRMVELVGEDEDGESFPQIDLPEYLEALDEDRYGEHASGDLVAVVVARGDILEGDQPPGTVGGSSTSELIRSARQDDAVKALVLRVDSPGGMMGAAEEVRRSLELTREQGKPVVVSMGGVAASGGYHISMASDQIWASSTTLTGSIGVFAVLPTFQRPLQRYLGMRVDGVGTTPLAGTLRLDRELDPRLREVLQSGVQWAYRDFLEVVAQGRGMTPDAVDRVARGRVWSGRDALDLGLVDGLGTLDDAIASAADLAHLGDGYEVKYITEELGTSGRVLVRLLGTIGRMVDARPVLAPPRRPRSEFLGRLEREALLLERLAASHGPVAHSLLEVD